MRQEAVEKGRFMVRVDWEGSEGWRESVRGKVRGEGGFGFWVRGEGGGCWVGRVRMGRRYEVGMEGRGVR